MVGADNSWISFVYGPRSVDRVIYNIVIEFVFSNRAVHVIVVD